ncbi:S8 family serine peptidase [Metasolibacillus sp.]|uniref:S8 family serine peptidase n=1 Tax=Metasolibacillus sp. TaxID=2703680 RepID=UPI0025E1E733|nr:S8 family serine peptidase [Metasolibacillus sp.]
MRNKGITRLFAIFVALMMILSMLSPLQVSADSEFSLSKPANDEATLLTKAAIVEQLNIANGPAVLHPALQDVSGSSPVAVIVHLSEKPVALEKGIRDLEGKSFSATDAKIIKQAVQAQQAEVLKEMTGEQISFKQGYTFNTVLNGFAAQIKADDLEKLLEIEGVTLIEPDAEVYANEEASATNQVDAYMNTSNSFLGIEQLWAKGLEGQGIKMAVLDTGIDTTHPEFAGIYKGGKNFIVHDSNMYKSPRADNDATETKPAERPSNQPLVNARGSSYATSHGTHVAGTIAAIGANPYGIKGIAPKVDLYAYRVLGAYGSGATSGIIAAIEYAVEQEIDVINLSLGGGSNSENDASSFAINNAALAGVIPVIATGNSGPNRGTLGTPSTAPLGIAVGNSTNPETAYHAVATISASNFEWSQQLNLMATTFGGNLTQQLSGEFELVAVPGIGAATDYTNINVNGKIALISRGDIAFVEKIEHAKNAGAVGAIIHNFSGGTNAPGPSETFLGDSFDFIPTFDMSVTDGQAIRNALATSVGTISFNEYGQMTSIGDEINDSSSRGPSTPNFDIKPDVVAPGTNIMSTVPTYETGTAEGNAIDPTKAYDRKTGTSMATPHIAGIAALIKQANPSWTPFDVKVALANTADVLNTAKYDVFDQGAGRVNAYEAAFPSALAYVQDSAKRDASGEIVEHEKGAVTFGPQPIKAQNIQVTKEIVVKNINGTGSNYTVAVDMLKNFGDAQVTVDKSSFTLNGEEHLTVTLTASQNTAAKLGDEIFGYIHLIPTQSVTTETALSVNPAELNMKVGESVQLNAVETTTTTPDKHTMISLPFAADFGGEAPTSIENMAISETDLSFNGDGIKDSAELTFTLTGDVGANYIELWDLQNPEGGQYGDGYIGYLHAGTTLGAGSWRLAVNGSYTPWGGSGMVAIPDGVYTIDFTAEAKTGVISDYVGPVFMKSTKATLQDVSITPTSVTSGDTATITSGDTANIAVEGKVVDKYIDYKALLASYGLNYDVNSKLATLYAVTRNGEIIEDDLVTLQQDGTFAFDVEASLNEATDSVTMVILDAAGNISEQTVYGDPVSIITSQSVMGKLAANELQSEWDISNEVDVTEAAPNKLSFIAPVTLDNPYGSNHVSAMADGPTRPTTFTSNTVADVTKQATYTIADEGIVEVTEGLVSAKAAGTTTITVNYGNNNVVIPVTVTSESKPNPNPGNPNPGGGGSSGGGGGGATTPETKPEEKPEPEKPETTEPAEPQTPFMPIDLPADHWAASYIHKMIAKGLLKGNEKGEVKPDANVTRAQFASILTRALGLTAGGKAPFSDIGKYAPATQAEIAAVFEAGIAKGVDGKYNPSGEVTRAQLALMLYRAYEYATGEKYVAKGKPSFTDLGKYNAETVSAIAMLEELSIATGDNGKFKPSAPATRAHTAKMVINFLEVIEAQ